MGILSDKLTRITFGTGTTQIIMEKGTYTPGSGSWSPSDTGNHLGIRNSSGTAQLHVQSGVWNAMWNDYADFQQLKGELVPGKCYVDTYEGAEICSARCQLSVIGIASDTFGMVVGNGRFEREVPIAVSGWVLAYVDKQYPCGTALTNNENGDLTEISLEEKRDYPERIVAIYKKPEPSENFGGEGRIIKVDNRHWVKVKS
jgi:hypothetical protein